MANNKKEQVTLKQAAEITGYSPDYIGQLIRQGKLPGKQVYKNISWVTTREAVEDYIKANSRKNDDFSLRTTFKAKYWQIKNGLLIENQFSSLIKLLMYITIFVSVIFLLVLLYIFSVNLDKKIQANALKNATINYETNFSILNPNLPKVP